MRRLIIDLHTTIIYQHVEIINEFVNILKSKTTVQVQNSMLFFNLPFRWYYFYLLVFL